MLTAVADALMSVALSPLCAGCGAALDHPTRGAVCDACWLACASGIYDGPLQNIIHAFKYDGRRSLADGLAALMRERHAALIERADVAVPVPLHSLKRCGRGFNQADDLASLLGLPVVRALRRTRKTATQAELAGVDRAANVSGAFAPTRHAAAVRDRVVVLVDDVTTTGSTLAACASVLSACGSREVHAVTAAVAVLRH